MPAKKNTAEKKILNVSFDYNKDVSIFTLEYLNTYYTGIIANYGYKQVTDKFINQKAMKNDILIVGGKI